MLHFKLYSLLDITDINWIKYAIQLVLKSGRYSIINAGITISDAECERDCPGSGTINVHQPVHPDMNEALLTGA